MTATTSTSPMRLYLIGDSTLDLAPPLLGLLQQSRHDAFLQSFFRSAQQVLRAEIARLTSSCRALFPRFSSIQDLVGLLQRGSKQLVLHPALHKALVCCFHLATFINRCENQDDVFTQVGDTYLVGLCTGALAAAAVSSSRHVADLVRLAPHAVRIAFRTALRAYEVADMIEPDSAVTSKSSSSWSMTVTTSAEEAVRAAVSDFCNDRVPITSWPYISFVAKSGSSMCITISGPPSVLGAIKETRLHVADHRIINLDLHVPYHANHLFTVQDVDAILDTCDHQWSHFKSQIPVISAATGAIRRSARNYNNHLRGAVEDILLHPVMWEDVVNGVGYISRFSSTHCAISIRPVGTCYHSHLRMALENLGHEVATLDDPRQQEQTPLPDTAATASGKSKIAIVGMSGRFPSADNLDAFWDLLSKGLDVHSVVPPSRWNAATHVDPTGTRKNTSRTPYGCWLNNPAAFDAKFFSVTPREAPQIDPASRIALMTTYEAMEMAGMVAGSTPSTQKDRVGVVYGVTSNDWMEVNSAQNIDAFFIPGGCRAFIPGRVNYFFKFGGPSFSLDTACSSSMAAIHTACNLLWQRDADTVIAGGTNVLTNPDYTAGLDRGRFLSTTGNCKSFDQTADGYCRAEAVCTVILKRLDDAIAEKDPILGVILGSYTNHSAEADSITRPLADAQKQVFSRILNDASVSPLDVSYVEMHGTGTQAGDPVEMDSVASTFAPAGGPLRRTHDNPLHVGAVKSSVGHAEAAAGATSLAKVLLMMRHNTIPPHAGIRTKLNENFPADMDQRNIRIAREPLDWERRASLISRKAFVNSFSAAGGNSAILVEEAPQRPLSQNRLSPDNVIMPSTQILIVSAKTPGSLRRNIKSLADFLASQNGIPETLLANISYTTTARRTHHPYRVAVCGSSIQQVKMKLEKEITDVTSNSSSNPRITFAFTGNGSQYVGMGKQLMEVFPSFRADMTRFDQILQMQGFRSMLPFVRGKTSSDDVDDAAVEQVAAVCLELALAHLWMSWGIKPAAVVGHSLGEYAALAVARVLSEADTIFLVARRAQLLQKKCKRGSHAMLAVRGASQSVVLDMIQTSGSQDCEIACVNEPDQTVASGSVEDLIKLKKSIQNKGMAATMLRVPYAFHSAQVEPMLDELEVACQGVAFHKPTIPVISPLLATTIGLDQDAFSPRYLRRHCREPVNFLNAMHNAHASGVIGNGDISLEIGPQSIISGIIKSIFSGVASITTMASIRKNQDVFSTICPALCSLYQKGCDVDWREYHSAFPASQQVVQLPAYNWELKDYWIQYVHDWSLRKGDPPLESVASRDVSSFPKLEGTSIHQVIEDSLVGDKTLSIVVETDLSREHMRPLAQGHKVNKIPLATPSIYAEIVLRIGQHIADKYQPHLNKGYVMTVDDMTIEHALVVPDYGNNQVAPTPTLLRSTASFDLEISTATCHFTTLDLATHKAKQQHSRCVLKFIKREAARTALQDRVSPARSRIKALGSDEIGTGQAYRFSNSMIYKIVGSLAQFSPLYRQVDEIVLRSEVMEASSRVSFGKELTDFEPPFSFHTHPAAIDALSQSAGFIMNGHDGADLDNEVFVNHGWTSFQLFEKLVAGKTYITYCSMVEGENKRWDGDCIVLDGEGDDGGHGRIVAWFGGINLQGVPRRVLQYILSGEAKSSLQEATIVSSFSSPQTSQAASTKLSDPPVQIKPVATTGISPVASSTPGSANKVQLVLQILTEETGIPINELADNNTTLADLGVDSLLQLLIASRLSEDMDVHIEPSSFHKMRTIKDLCHLIAPPGPPFLSELSPPRSSTSPIISATKAMSSRSSSCSPVHSSTETFDSITSNEILVFESHPGHQPETLPPLQLSEPLLPNYKHRPASSVILHGRPRTDPQTLFLFPDGSGRATSYVHMAPHIRPGLAIIGLNSPYTRHPDEILLTSNVTLQGTMESYLTEIRRRQPQGGPYHLGGWSSGGILAFLAAQMLIREGDIVESLVLIDAPPPRVSSLPDGRSSSRKGMLDPLPERWYDHCSKAGIFHDGHPGSGQQEDDEGKGDYSLLIKHFRAQIKVLRGVDFVDPLPEGFTPRTSILWAGECVFDGRRPGRALFEVLPGDAEGVEFLARPRTDWTAGAWGRLVPGERPEVEVMAGKDHFGMMQKEGGKELAIFVGTSVDGGHSVGG